MPTPSQSRAGFTLVEVLIGMGLALMVMSAVISSYMFLGRNFTRALGINSSSRPTLEAQGRQTLLQFEQDVRMGTAISGLPSASSLSLTVPTGTGTSTVNYAYVTSATTLNGVSVPAGSLARYITGGSTLTVLHSDLLSCVFSYYDSSGNPYTSFSNYLVGIKQVSLTFTSQTGSSTNGTQTPVYTTTSSRILMRNTAYLQ